MGGGEVVSFGFRQTVKQSSHGEVIVAAAKRFLEPLGCLRKGKSRFWYSDEQFWLICIEFQPSGWSRGTYLNIGVHWLWHTSPHFTFDLVDRVKQFVRFETSEQFEKEVARLAALAAKEVEAFRSRFVSLKAISRYLGANHADKSGWPVYHAALAAGLAGDAQNARGLFAQLKREPFETDWQQALGYEAAYLASLLNSPEKYLTAIRNKIEQSRSLLDLAPAVANLEI